MRTFIIAAAMLLAGAAVPASHHDLSPVGTVVSAMPLQAQPAPPSDPSSPATSPSSEPAAQPAQSQPAASQPAPEVNVEVHSSSWHANPTWVAIGIMGAVLLVVIVVLATRTGSNTVIRG